MANKTAVCILAGAYLLGSIPFGLIVGLVWRRVDIRKYGSGNIGASNVLRILGWPAAALVSVLDVSKGFVPVWVAQAYTDVNPTVVVLAALAAILGHNYSVFLKFRGGKGVATSLGVIIGLVPHIAVLVFVIWVLMIVLTRYISVASMVAGVSVPIMMYLSSQAQNRFVGRPLPPEYLYLGLLGAGFIVLKHRGNLVRLANGTEPRIGQRVALEHTELREPAGEGDGGKDGKTP